MGYPLPVDMRVGRLFAVLLLHVLERTAAFLIELAINQVSHLVFPRPALFDRLVKASLNVARELAKCVLPLAIVVWLEQLLDLGTDVARRRIPNRQPLGVCGLLLLGRTE